jgi:hypothetical protein
MRLLRDRTSLSYLSRSRSKIEKILAIVISTGLVCSHAHSEDSSANEWSVRLHEQPGWSKVEKVVEISSTGAIKVERTDELGRLCGRLEDSQLRVLHERVSALSQSLDELERSWGDDVWDADELTLEVVWPVDDRRAKFRVRRPSSSPLPPVLVDLINAVRRKESQATRNCDAKL